MNSGTPKNRIIAVFESIQKQLSIVHESQADIVSEVTTIREILHEMKNSLTPIAFAADAWTRDNETDQREITRVLKAMDELIPKVDSFLTTQSDIQRRLAALEGGGRYGTRGK